LQIEEFLQLGLELRLRPCDTASTGFLPDGEHLVSVGLDNSAQLWDIHEEKPRAALWGVGEESFSGVAVFRGGNHIAVTLADGRIRVWGPAV
jgi:WD40 repeat protein